MNKKDRQLCEAVLSPGEEIGRLSFVKVMRNGSLLLALPLSRQLALATLGLYQPQKWKGRCLRLALRVLVVLGMHRFLPQFEVKLGDRGLFTALNSLTERGDFGFLLGNPDSLLRNLIGLYEIEGELCVVKVGCGEAAQVVTREYESMTRFADGVAGVPACKGIFDIEGGVAYVAEFVRGKSPRTNEHDGQVLALLNDFLNLGEKSRVAELECWQSLASAMDPMEYGGFQSLSDREVISPVMHGDFAPWNIKINGDGHVRVLDWECASPAGMPGWDWLHYHVQRMILVEESSAEEIVKKCDALLRSEPMQSYLIKAGVGNHENLLLGSYLYYSGRVHDYPREELIKAWKLAESTQSK